MDLELKIKALVQGIDDIRKLGKEIADTGTASTKAGSESVTAASKTEQAYKTLGIRAFADIRAEISKVEAAYKTLASSGTLSAKEQGVAAATVKSKIAELNNEMKGIKDASSTGLSGLSSMLAPAVAGFLSLSVAIEGVKKASAAAMELDKIKNALQATIGSAEGAKVEYAFVREEANRLGLSLQTAAKDYTSLTAATKGTSLAGEQTRKIFTSVSEASAVLGLSADETSGALMAVQQMISKGTVSAEELRGQLGERLPGAFQIAARAMGVSTAELGKMLEAGTVATEEFLPKFSEEIKKTFSDGLPGAIGSARAEFERLQNTIFETAAAVGQSGLNQGLAEAAALLREKLADPLVLESLKSIGSLIGTVAVACAGLAGVLTEYLVPAVGILVAGFKDGLMFIGAVLASLAGAVVAFAGVTLQAFGKVVSFFNADLGKAMTDAGKKLRETGDELVGFGKDVTKNFAEGKSEMGKFNQGLAESKGKAQEFANASELALKKFTASIADMGLKMIQIGNAQYLTPINAEFDKLSKTLTTLASDANATSAQFRQAFAKGLDSAKTLTDIGALTAALKEAEKSGKDVGEAAASINSKFEQVFDTSLKAAKTKDDFRLLAAQLQELGEKGEVSTKLVNKAMEELIERIKGAGDQALTTAKQLTEIGKANVDVGKAQLNVARADYEVGKSRLDVWKAQNNYAKDGSALSRAELALAQANLRLAESKAQEARLAFAEEKAHRNVIIASQNQELALIRLKLDPNNEALILAEKAAKKTLEGEQLAYEAAKQRSEKQQEITLKAEEEVLKRKLITDEARATAEQAEKMAGHITNAGSGAMTLGGNLGKAANEMERLANASKQVKTPSGGGGSGGGMSMGGGSGGGQTGGSDNSKEEGSRSKDGSVVVMGDPRQQSTPTSAEDFAKNGKNNSSYTDKDNVTWSKNSQCQMGNNQTPTGTTTNSAEENRWWDFKEGKIGAPDKQDAEYVKSQWTAARANLETMQRLPAGFVSQDYVKSVYSNYNIARRAMEAMGLSTGNGSSASLSANPFGGGSTAPGALAGIGGGGAGGFGRAPAPPEPTITADTLADQIRPQQQPYIPSSDVVNQTAAPSKVIQVNFTDGTGKTVPMTVNANDEQSLLDMLKRAKGMSS
jgi:tape measure domain-containing protein